MCAPVKSGGRTAPISFNAHATVVDLPASHCLCACAGRGPAGAAILGAGPCPAVVFWRQERGPGCAAWPGLYPLGRWVVGWVVLYLEVIRLEGCKERVKEKLEGFKVGRGETLALDVLCGLAFIHFAGERVGPACWRRAQPKASQQIACCGEGHCQCNARHR